VSTTGGTLGPWTHAYAGSSRSDSKRGPPCRSRCMRSTIWW
jgi:hypothetical protein